MLSVRLIYFGKTKEQFIRQGEAFYEKKLSRYIRFEKIVLKEEGNLNMTILERQKIDAQKLKKYLDQSRHKIFLDKSGQTKTSEQFAGSLEKCMIRGMSHVDVYIGASVGFLPELLSRSNDTVSLSSLTFSHELARLVFLEQLYRSMKLLKGEAYHK